MLQACRPTYIVLAVTLKVKLFLKNNLLLVLKRRLMMYTILAERWIIMNISASFGELVRHHRLEAGLSLVKLAQQAEVSHSYITLLERGQRTNPSYKLVKQFADALKLRGDARNQFFTAAQFTQPAGQNITPKYSHPLMKAVIEFLALGPNDSDLPDAVQRIVRELVGAAVRRRIPPGDRALIKGAGLASFGSFHQSSTRKKGHPKVKKLTPSQARLADNVCKLMAIIADGNVPISKRISLVEELTSLAQWKLKSGSTK